jgi:1-acyl-sn-glycerol-3-phosphate acyltransferase
MMRPRRLLRVLPRLVAVAGLVLGGIVLAASYRVVLGRGWFLRPAGERLIQGWMRRLALVLGMHISVTGTMPPGASLVIANHISWLDIIALNATAPMSFLAKDAVRAWPLLGPLAAITGTMFLRRGSLSAMNRGMEEIAARLRAGHRVTLFPEGTTSNGSTVLLFHRALLRSARMAGVPLQPVAISYRRGRRRDTIVPFVGDDEFLSNLLRVLAAGPLHVQLVVCASSLVDNGNSPGLAQAARRSIIDALAPEVGERAGREGDSPVAEVQGEKEVAGGAMR